MELFHLQHKSLIFDGFVRNVEKPFLRRFLLSYKLLLIAMNVYFLCMRVLFIVEHSSELLRHIDAISPLCIDFVTFAKFLTYWYWLPHFYELTDTIKLMAREHSSGSGFIVLSKANERARFLAKPFLIFTLIGSALYCIKPVLIFWINFFNGVDSRMEFPLKASSLFDMDSSPAFEITYFASCYSIYVAAVTSISIDSIFLICCLNIGAHFEILRESIGGREKKDIVECHQRILDLTSKLNGLYKPLLFIEFLIFSILLCAIGFQIVMADGLVEKSPPISFFLIIFTQLLFYCYSCQHVMDKSVEVCSDVYAMDRDYLVIIARSQIEVKIATYFFCPSLEVFANVMNTTYGYISILQSMLE